MALILKKAYLVQNDKITNVRVVIKRVGDWDFAGWLRDDDGNLRALYQHRSTKELIAQDPPDP